MKQFVCDAERCIQCGECVKDCPAGCLRLTDEVAEMIPEREALCIECQHCLSICPTAAVSIMGCDPDKSLSLDTGLPGLEAMEQLVRGRRSTRKYRNEPVEPELLERLLQDLAYAPTGVNDRSLLFTVVDDIEVMDQLRQESIQAFTAALSKGGSLSGNEYLAKFLGPLKRGVDVVFRGAPHMLVVTVPDSAPAGEADPMIALSYFELLANAAGLGTVWCGFGKAAVFHLLEGGPERFGIPADHTRGYVMAFGKPDVSYYRTVQRGPAAINRYRP